MLAKAWLLPTISLVFLGACAHAKIPRTDIADTEDNRAIMRLVDEYQHALEALDADAVLALVSPAYYEDNGNTVTDDDYDYNGLRSHLVEDFKRTKALHLDVRVDAVEVTDTDAFAELYYRIRAQNEYPSGVKWETGSDRTRIRFQRTDGKWLITAGL